jgi:Hypoxia induced protein conserved region
MSVLTGVIVIALLLTVGALIWGIVSMAKGGKFDQHHSHQLMFARVGLQGITLLLLLVALFIAVK